MVATFLLDLPDAILIHILYQLLDETEPDQAIDNIIDAAVSCRALRLQADAILAERLAKSSSLERSVAKAWRLAGFRLLQVCDAGSSYGEGAQLRAFSTPHMRWVLGSKWDESLGEPPVLMDSGILRMIIGEIHPVLFEWNRVGRDHEGKTWSSANCPIVMVGGNKTYTNGARYSLAVLGILQQWMPDVPAAFGGPAELAALGKALLRKHANNVDEASVELAWRAAKNGCVMKRRTKKDRQYVSCTGQCTVPQR